MLFWDSCELLQLSRDFTNSNGPKRHYLTVRLFVDNIDRHSRVEVFMLSEVAEDAYGSRNELQQRFKTDSPAPSAAPEIEPKTEAAPKASAAAETHAAAH